MTKSYSNKIICPLTLSIYLK